MSDVSEHDSDSDNETNEEVTKIAPAVSSTAVEMAAASSSSVSNLDFVDELKNTATKSTSSDEQPEWMKYLQQSEETGSYTYTDQKDGMVYEWDATKKGWIPKINDDFIAMYQANYGFTATGEHNPYIHMDSEEKEEEKKEEEKKASKNDNKSEVGKKPKQEEKKEWFEIESKNNNNVYVSGLPISITDDEFVELMTKCGIIMLDDSGKPKIKLYRDSNGVIKGDGRCCYLKHESVTLACNLLDESDVKGSKISVEVAVFELKGVYDPTKKPKKKKKKRKATQDKLLDWVDRPKKRSKFDRIVILKNMFDYKEFEKDPATILDLKEDLRSECEKFGEVKKVLVFDRNPEGVASILFVEPDFADRCIEALNGRYYAGKVISAITYDGITDYNVKETEKELALRLQEWEQFLGADDDDDATTTTAQNEQVMN